MRLPDLPLVVLDTETTGFVPRVHRIIEFASMRAEKGEIVDTFSQLLFAEEIPPHVEVLTRIKTDDVKGMPPFEEKKEEIARHIPEGSLIVGQNILFDLSMLKGAGIDLTGRPWIDTSLLASLVFPELQSYSLGYLSAVLNLHHAPTHRALDDVRATLEVLSRCWERLLLLTNPMRKEALSIMERAPEGYRMLFEALPKSSHTTRPPWLRFNAPKSRVPAVKGACPQLRVPAIGQVSLQEEPLDSSFLPRILAAASEGITPRWIAVKNIDLYVRRLPSTILESKGKEKIRILYPPSHLVDAASMKKLNATSSLTVDEATLALKLAWYEPRTRNEFPIHGGEEDVWSSKIACTETCPEYIQQMKDLPPVVILDHRQLLHILDDEHHPARSALTPETHVMIDDASMLEDTATNAYGWICNIDELRAGSQGNELLTHFTDLLQLWIEKTRGSQDLRYLTTPDLTTPEAKGLREQLQTTRQEKHLLPQARSYFDNLEKILNPDNLAQRFVWIEQRQNGAQVLHSVPARIGTLLATSLFQRQPTTLLIPPASEENHGEILIESCVTNTEPAPASPSSELLPVSFPLSSTPTSILSDPPPGKTILLVPSRGAIETLYVKHMEALEKRGITLICQGVSGGQKRMQAEFLASTPPAIWALTPWTFEGIELPPGSVDRLIIGNLPFDYYSHPVLSRRAQRYKDSFKDYFLPRLLHRLFRILRTFVRFRTAESSVQILDDRIRTKGYGNDIIAYLSNFTATEKSDAKTKSAAKPEGKEVKEKSVNQLKLF